MEIEEKELKGGIREIYLVDKETGKKRLIFKIDTKKRNIILYPEKPTSFFSSEITFEGFDSIPPEVSSSGYIKAGLEYYLNNRLGKIGAKKLTISTENESDIKKLRGGLHVIVSYEDFKWIKKHFTNINNAAKADRAAMMAEFLSKTYPSKFTANNTNTKSRALRVISLLDDSIIEHLGETEMNRILAFVESFLHKRYKSDAQGQKLLKATKLKVDEIALNKIIKEFEALLKGGVSEDRWSKFLKKNLYLFDSKYIKLIDQLNVILAKSRKVDFALIDSAGFLDLFEIKKATTKILAKQTDRGNYYWSTDMTKAVTQLEKYLYNAEAKGANLKTDIEREYGDIKVNVIRPRAVLVVGSSKQLDTKSKMDDFRVLRRSLKNIEIVLFDEMLQQIKNIKDKIYLD